MTLWEAAILGIVQGVTEFLPISSTAHLVVVRKMMGHENPDDAFTIVVQLGTLLAVFTYFRADLVAIVRGLFLDVRNWRLASCPESRLAWKIAFGTIPVVCVGFFAKKFLKENFYTLPAMGVVAIVFALLLELADRRARLRPHSSNAEVTWKESFWIGLWQMLALMPGASRSGTTLTGGLFAGLDRSAAARFSFLLSLPAILGAGVKELYDESKKTSGLFSSRDEAAALGVGLLLSAVVGYLAIAWLLKILKTHTTRGFVIYRIVFGITILVWWFISGA